MAVWKKGEIVAGQYEVLQVFTSGGMGDVYRVHHRDWDMSLALKRPRLTAQHARNIVYAFRQECEIWASLNLHPHLVTCYYVRTIDGVPCVLTEFVDGGSLRDWIQSRRLYTGTEEAAFARVLDLAIQSAWGLESAHAAGLVHQDVKPGNILVSADGTAKVTDFGLARATERDSEAARAVVAGQPDNRVSVNGMTPAYCSPEQTRKERVSHRTDIYSWAIAVFEMFNGDVTWSSGPAARFALRDAFGESPTDGLLEMPESVFELLVQCTEEDPALRPNGFCEITDRLQAVFLDALGEPHARVRPDAAIAEADSLNNRALSMIDLGHPEEAEKLLEMILHLHDANHPEAVFNLALLGLNRTQSSRDAALLSVARIVKLEPELSMGWLLLSKMQVKLGMHNDALQSIDEALRLINDEPSLGGGQALAEWQKRVKEDKSIIVPYAVVRPKCGSEYYEELRKFERLCVKMQRALETANREDASRYLQQAQDLSLFRRHPKLKALSARITSY